MFWLVVSQAFAGALYTEEALEEYCIGTGDCPLVIGTVVDSECYSVLEDEMGAFVTRYRATIQVSEDVDGIGIGEQFVLQTVNYDYSQTEDSPGCYETDPGHPIGEEARYYLNPQNEDGIYFLYGPLTYFETESSAPSSVPECPSLDDEEEENLDETSQQDDEIKEESSTSCSSLQQTPIKGLLWSLLPLGLVWFRRR